MPHKKKIAVITGTRAEYGILSPVMKAINASPKLELQIVATGMHLMPEFGYTFKEIEKAGYSRLYKVDSSYSEDTGLAMAGSFGLAVKGFSKIFMKIKPNLILVLGDRGEMLAAAIAANYLNLAVAHIHGGEISGHVDGLFRHAITKLAHLHFPATSDSKKRIIGLGEEKWRIKVVGAPALDRISKEKLPDRIELEKKYGLRSGEKYILLVQHPVLTEAKAAADQIRNTLEAIKKTGMRTIVFYPNADAGGRRMIQVIESYRHQPWLKILKSIPQIDYLGLLKHASVLVGNSSSGIIEAPSFNLPVINVGSRQKGRQRSTNVIDVKYDGKTILKALKKALYDKRFLAKVKSSKNPYGNGRASERIVDMLRSIRIDNRLLQKQMTY